MKRAALAFVVAVLCGCGGDGSSVLGGYSALDSCDYGPICAAHFARATAVENPSPELRSRLLHIKLNALLKFPPLDASFLESIGVSREAGYNGLNGELDALSKLPDAASAASDAGTIIEFFRKPDCRHFTELEAVQKGGGVFADSASVAAISALTQILSSVTPDNSSFVASAARPLVGCLISERAGAGAVLVASKVRLMELLDRCPADSRVDTVYKSTCAEGKAFVAQLAIPLPISDAVSGETAGALPPSGRSIGLPINPPWIFSLSAGRLMVIDQPVVPPEVRDVPDLIPEMLIDLRDVHRPEDIKTAVHLALKARSPWARRGDDRTKFIFIAVDRSTTFAELSEVMGGMMSETDAYPMVAVIPSGASSPVWRPLNMFIRTRHLFSPDFTRTAWGAAVRGRQLTEHLEMELTPFSLIVDGRSIEIPRGSNGLVAGNYDLRDVNSLAVEMVGAGHPGSLGLKVSSGVSFELLVQVIEAMSYRFADGAVADATGFLSAQPLRKNVGEYQHLLAWPVLDRN